MAGQVKRGGRRHRVLAALAAHPDGLTSRQLAELDGVDAGQLTLYGGILRALRDDGQAVAAGEVVTARKGLPAIVYRITDAGRQELAAMEARHPGPVRRKRPEYPWAAKAAERYRAGEPRRALCAAYGVSDTLMQRVLESEDVTLRGPREAQVLRQRSGREHEAARLRRELLSRIDGLYAAAEETDSPEVKAVTLDRAAELEECADALREVLRRARHPVRAGVI